MQTLTHFFLSIAFCLCWVGPGLAGESPNILLIMADDVGTDAISCYGSQSYDTPNIDALASGGLKFEHGYSMAVCHPSRICLMTGRYPFRFGRAGSQWGRFPRDAEGITIAHRMKQGGYATAVAGKWQLCFMKKDLQQPRRLGFDEWLLFGWHEGARYHDPFLYQTGKYREDTDGKYGPDLYVDFLIDFMGRSNKQGKPFFAYYPMALSHDVTDDLKDRHVSFYQHDRWMSYAEMVSSMDDMVGRLIEALDELGLREDTLVVFTTDNGTPSATYSRIDDKGKMVRTRVYSIRDGEVVPGGKGKLDDTGTRVPWITNWPGRISPGKVVNDMVDLTDLLPTLAEVANLPEDSEQRDGKSFAPVLFGEDRQAGRDWVYLEHRGERAVRSENWKLYGNGAFFDMRRDPGETSALDPESLTGKAAQGFSQLQAVLSGMTAGE